MKKRALSKVGLLGLTACFVLGLAVKVALAEEEDWFPLCLWAVFSDYPQDSVEWDAERMCLDSIKANRLEACVPNPVEVLDSLCDNRGFWLTVEGLPDTSLDYYWRNAWYWWYYHHIPDSGWPDGVDHLIQRMYEVYGSHSGLYGYLVAHESFYDPYKYPAMEYVRLSKWLLLCS